MEFPTEIKKGATWGEVLGPAMRILNQKDADLYFEMMVQYSRLQDPHLPLEKIEENLRSSLGYYAGYYDHETRKRVERLFGCVHPVFGAVTETPMAPQEAFDFGVKYAREAFKKRG